MPSFSVKVLWSRKASNVQRTFGNSRMLMEQPMAETGLKEALRRVPLG
ncbi:MAG: hypothetical protein ACHBNF_20040 [Chromatiales bacterium]